MVTFESRAGHLHCQVDVDLKIIQAGIDDEEDANYELRLALSRGLGGMPIIETGAGFELKTLEDGKYLCKVDLDGDIPLRFLIKWDYTEERGGGLELVLQSYGICKATSMACKSDHSYFKQVLRSSMEAFLRHGVREDKIIAIQRFLGKIEELTKVGIKAPLGEFSLQTYINIVNDLKKLGFVPLNPYQLTR